MQERGNPPGDSNDVIRDVTSSDSSEGAAPSVGQTRLRILIADDNQDSAETLSMLIGLMGHEVRVAFDGIDAVTVAEEFRPHLALLDIGMPRQIGRAHV